MCDGETVNPAESLFLLAVSGRPTEMEWQPKELLDTARSRVYEMLVNNEYTDEGRVTIARALRRRIDHAVPISEAEKKDTWIKETEWTVEESMSSPDSTAPEESQASMEIMEQEEAATETPPEDVFNMQEVEDALPQAEWTLILEPANVTPEMGFQERSPLAIRKLILRLAPISTDAQRVVLVFMHRTAFHSYQQRCQAEERMI